MPGILVRGSRRTSRRHVGSGLVAVAALAAFALVGCGGVAQEVTGALSRDSGSAVAPADVPGGKASSAPAATEARPAQGAPDGAPLPSADTERRIIRSGTADLEVRSVSDAFEAIRQIATAAGGHVADSSFSGGAGRETATMALRVPVDRFGDVLAKLRDVSVQVRSITTGSSDVTDEYTDIEATLRNLRAVEAQYVALLGRAGSIGDVLQVQDRLNQTRLQIDRTEARRQSLAARSEMSTITVSLRPASVAVRGEGPLAQAQRAWQASLATLALIGTTLLVVAVYSWWLVPPAALTALLLRRMLRRQAERQRAEPSSV